MSESYGDYVVGISFNPSGNSTVDEIKRKTAELIDLCRSHIPAPSGEIGRLWHLAMTHYEDAAMWAVKAATKIKPNAGMEIGAAQKAQ